MLMKTRWLLLIGIHGLLVCPSMPSAIAQNLAPPSPAPSKAPEATSQPAKAPESNSSTTTPIKPATLDGLNPDPNPVATPTKPDEVKIKTTQGITLNEALTLALRNSPQLKISEQQILRSQDVLKQAKAAYYPVLDIQSGYTHEQTFLLNPETTTFTVSGVPDSVTEAVTQATTRSSISASDIFSAGASVSYNVYTSGLRKAQVKAAERQIVVDELGLDRQKQDLFLNVFLAYYSLQNADEQVRINQAAVTNAQKSLQDTQAQERAGLGTRFDVLQAQVQLANAVQALTDSRSTQQIAQRQLAQLLNVNQSANLTTSEPVAIAGTWELTLEESVIGAFQDRVELKQLIEQRRISEQRRIAALAANRPQVGVNMGYSLGNDFNQNNSLTTGFSIGANVSWRAFDGGSAKALASQSSRDAVTADLSYENTRTQIRFAVEQAYLTMRSSFESIQTATLSVEQAEEALRLARLRFQAGVGTQTDVINSETALTRAQGNKVNAIIGYNRALAQLKRSLNLLSS
jgi:outer membrane protein TolC